nr:hypothetical protein [uncultured bacterium]
MSILDIAPHRVYLGSLQHYLYILSVALVLSQNEFGMTAVSRYAILWCPDFPIHCWINKAACCRKGSLSITREQYLLPYHY